MQEQIDALDSRLTSLENGGNFKTLGADLERISIEFFNRFSYSIETAIQDGLQGIPFDFTALRSQMAEHFKEAFSNLGKFAPHLITKEEATKTLTSNPYFKDFKSWQEDGNAKNFDKRKNFDQELIRNLELRNASLNVAYYNFIEKYAKELEGIQLSFEDFLNMDVELFRGAAEGQIYKNGRLASFSPIKDVAKGFATKKGKALYSVRTKIGDTLGAPGLVLDDGGEELEILVQLDGRYLDQNNRLSDSLVIARNEEKKTGLQSVETKNNFPAFMSNEFIQNLKKVSEERIQAEKDYNRRIQELKEDSLKREKEIQEARLKKQQEQDKQFIESELFQEAKKQYPWLDKIQPRQVLGDEVYNIENLSDQDIKALEKLYDERIDLEFDFLGDKSAYISIESLNQLLEETSQKAKNAKTEISNLTKTDASFDTESLTQTIQNEI